MERTLFQILDARWMMKTKAADASRDKMVSIVRRVAEVAISRNVLLSLGMGSFIGFASLLFIPVPTI